jgi:hypothetical protein
MWRCENVVGWPNASVILDDDGAEGLWDEIRGAATARRSARMLTPTVIVVGCVPVIPAIENRTVRIKLKDRPAGCEVVRRS